MGAVYLATPRHRALRRAITHLAAVHAQQGIRRALQKRTRAAGGLRHPDVVDVTDFGFARVKAGQVAYLVMKYLDGCTLGDVLAEEKRLPLERVADILDQVCSPVHEAHQKGMIHRDLQPDNIWLELNRLGSYRVKVLDFGVAKLGEAGQPADDDPALTIIDDVAAAAALENDSHATSRRRGQHTTYQNQNGRYWSGYLVAPLLLQRIPFEISQAQSDRARADDHTSILLISAILCKSGRTSDTLPREQNAE